MRFYIDLNKAGGQVPSTATSTVDDRQAARNYNESFSRRSSGVAGNDTQEDPQQGGKWSHDEPLDDELEADRKRDTQIAQERGIVSKPAEDTKKSETVEILKSLTSVLRNRVSTPTESEIEFLTTQCYKSESVLTDYGTEKTVRVNYTKDDVMKGYARIEGADRVRFNAWLSERFQKSLGKLVK